MSSPVQSVSPLIPAPAGNGTPLPHPPPTRPDLDDLFATLFSPATPPASPLLGSSSIFTLPSNPRPPLGSINSASSTDSDFGAFVSVPASEDPLAQPSSISSPIRIPSSGRHLGASDGFFAEAQAATARNQQGLLAELLEHEDDPMYWHEHAPSPLPSSSPIPPASASAIPSGSTTPQPSQPQPIPDSAVQILGTLVEPVKSVVETAVVNPLLEALNEATSENTFAQPPPPPRSDSFSTPPRRSEKASSSPLIRSPSLPPSPSRPSPPILSRVESTSTFSSSSLPSRWMTSFLTYRPPRSTTPPAGVGSTRLDITHGSPFAATPFVPASGAPGFDGDRAWNKGFDTDDGANSPERRGVQLLGRKESTRVVLGTSLANSVRLVPETCILFFIFTDSDLSDISTSVASLALTSPCAPPAIVDAPLQYRSTWDLVAYALRSQWRACWWRAARRTRRR